MPDQTIPEDALKQASELLEAFPRHAELANGIIIDILRLKDFVLRERASFLYIDVLKPEYIDYIGVTNVLDMLKDLIEDLEKELFPDFQKSLTNKYMKNIGIEVASLPPVEASGLPILTEYALERYWDETAAKEIIKEFEQSTLIAQSLISMLQEFLRITNLTSQEAINNAIKNPYRQTAAKSFLENIKLIARVFKVNLDNKNLLE